MRGRGRAAWVLGLALLGAGAPAAADEVPVAEREAELRAAETAFAATMARRDLEGFARFLAPDAIFFSGDRALRGARAVVEAWRPYYESETAPFSWEPEVVAVLESGELGMTSGPVRDPAGRRVGTFQSVWRRNPDGTWSVVFDRGCAWCEPEGKPEP